VIAREAEELAERVDLYPEASGLLGCVRDALGGGGLPAVESASDDLSTPLDELDGDLDRLGRRRRARGFASAPL
jgi:hypothetical protein